MNCLADIDITALASLNEGVMQECERCEGTGKVGRGHPNAPEPDYYETCGSCNGTGEVLVEAEPADEERMEEA